MVKVPYSAIGIAREAPGFLVAKGEHGLWAAARMTVQGFPLTRRYRPAGSAFAQEQGYVFAHLVFGADRVLPFSYS